MTRNECKRMLVGEGQMRGRAILCFVVTMLGLAGGGCSLFGVLAYKASGPEPVAAKYKPTTRPILVLVENRSQPSVTIGPEMLTSYVMEDLTDNKVGPLVPPEKLQAVRDAHLSNFASMSIAAIGKETGAGQVMYVQMDEDDIEPVAGSSSLQGKTSVRVRMIDVSSGETLWPVDSSDGYPLSASTALGSDSILAKTGGGVEDIRRKLYGDLAGEIGRLFHEWQPENEMPQDSTQ